MFTLGPIPRIYPIAPSRTPLGAMGYASPPPPPPPPDLSATLSVIVPGEPIAQPRHRSSVKMIRNPATGGIQPLVHLYIPGDHPVHGYKKDVAEAVRRALPVGWDRSGPVTVGCLFVFGRITKLPKKGGRVPKATKPDADNLLKAVWDACKGLAWDDDAQVAAAAAVKVFGAPHDEPHTVVVFDRKPDAILSGEWARRLAAALARV
jgi:Holliday junction resolvase RusA-like endonuclease